MVSSLLGLGLALAGCLALRLDEGGEREEAVALASRARGLLAPHVRPGTEHARWLEVIDRALADWEDGTRGV